MDLQKFINTKLWGLYGPSYSKRYPSYLKVSLATKAKAIKGMLAEKKQTVIIRLSPFMFCYMWASNKVIYGHGCFWYHGIKFVPDGRIDYEQEKYLFLNS